MKKILLLLPIMLIVLLSAKTKKNLTENKLVPFKNNLMVASYEVSNAEYKAYYKALDLRQQYFAHPDTTVFKRVLDYTEPYKNFYYQHEAYSNFPVVGVSYEQALAFCKWKTTQAKQNGLKHKYRLMTVAEWQELTAKGYTEKQLQKFDKKWPGASLYNFKRANEDNTTYITTAVDGFAAYDNGTHNLYGNVAELVTEKGIAMGGSWYHLEKNVLSNPKQKYTQPEAWLGFRYVVEIH